MLIMLTVSKLSVFTSKAYQHSQLLKQALSKLLRWRCRHCSPSWHSKYPDLPARLALTGLQNTARVKLVLPWP